MKVFISHTFQEKDKPLAEILQKTLSQKGIDGYIAEKVKEETFILLKELEEKLKTKLVNF